MSLKNPKTIGEKLRQLRILNNYLQKDVANLIGISRAMINYYECDKRVPTTNSIKLLANFYGVEVEELTTLIIKKGV